MKQAILFSLLTLLIISCKDAGNKNQRTEIQANIKTTDTISKAQKLKMYCTALENFSTAPNYVVVIAKNLNTGEVKEICTETNFLSGAITRQTGKNTSTISKNGVLYIGSTICEDYPNRYFEFSEEDALENISYDLYSESELNDYAKTVHIANTVERVKNGALRDTTFCYDDYKKCRKEQIMFAHLMFNNGIMMTRGCWAGNICALYPYEETAKNTN